MFFRESSVFHIDIEAFLKEHNQNGISHTTYTLWVAMGSSRLWKITQFLIPRTVMECYLEPSQLVTEEVLALLVTFEGAREVQIHLSLHVL